LTALAIWLVSYRVSRFPKAKKIDENVIQSITVPAIINSMGLTLLQPLPNFISDQWQKVVVHNRRNISAGQFQLRAKSPGFKFGRIGHAEVVDPSWVGWGMSGAGEEVDSRNYRPRLGLDLQQNFFVAIRPEDIPVVGSLDIQIPAQVTFLSGLESYGGNSDLEEAARTTAMNVIEGLMQKIGSRGPGFAGPDVFGGPAQGSGGQPNDPFNPNNSYRSGNDPFM
jgi:hypothetical protein